MSSTIDGHLSTAATAIVEVQEELKAVNADPALQFPPVTDESLEQLARIAGRLHLAAASTARAAALADGWLEAQYESARMYGRRRREPKA